MRSSPPLLGGGTWIGHGPSPVPYDEHIPPDNGVRGRPNMMPSGIPEIVDFPPGNDTPLEKMRWKNYHDKPIPSLFPSYEENKRMWQELEVERMMDYHPTHEIHATELPDYHYWPMIQNDVDPPRADVPNWMFQYSIDQTMVPRFHKNGVPKTPPQEQLWYIPRGSDGRFDWKKNAMVNNRNLLAYCSEEGWDNRYLRRIFRPWLAGRQRSKQAGVHPPIYFRHKELPKSTWLLRWLKGSYISTGMMFIPLYSAMLAYGGSAAGDFQSTAYALDGPWNPDFTILSMLARDKGTYHAII